MPDSHRSPFLKSLDQRLTQHQARGLVRRKMLRTGPCDVVQHFADGDLVSFCSNDYLGLANHPQVIGALQDGAARYGVGSGGSHLVTGHCEAHQLLEQALAEFTGRDRALLFSTGYMANIGVINALMPDGGVVLQDSLNHASLLDGGWLSRAQSVRYPHNDMAALAGSLEMYQGQPLLVVSDGVFSMDGDVALVPDLVSLTAAHGAGLMIDDAHGLGCLGEQGRGVVEPFSQYDVPVLVGTFGKALGTAGAFVAGDHALIDYLEQFARSYVFTTAMPPALAMATLASLKLLQQEGWRRERLQQLVQRFKAGVAEMAFPVLASESAVQAIVLGGVEEALAASALLRGHGLQVSAIRPPTVPRGESRLRVTLSAAHTDEQLDRLLSALALVSDNYDKNRNLMRRTNAG